MGVFEGKKQRSCFVLNETGGTISEEILEMKWSPCSRDDFRMRICMN